MFRSCRSAITVPIHNVSQWKPKSEKKLCFVSKSEENCDETDRKRPSQIAGIAGKWFREVQELLSHRNRIENSKISRETIFSCPSDQLMIHRLFERGWRLFFERLCHCGECRGRERDLSIIRLERRLSRESGIVNRESLGSVITGK